MRYSTITTARYGKYVRSPNAAVEKAEHEHGQRRPVPVVRPEQVAEITGPTRPARKSHCVDVEPRCPADVQPEEERPDFDGYLRTRRLEHGERARPRAPKQPRDVDAYRPTTSGHRLRQPIAPGRSGATRPTMETFVAGAAALIRYPAAWHRDRHDVKPFEAVWGTERHAGGRTASRTAPIPSTEVADPSRSPAPSAWPGRRAPSTSGPEKVRSLGSRRSSAPSSSWGSTRRAQIAVAAERAGGPAYVRGSAEQLPFADASFDTSIACLVFEHLPDHVPPIAEIERVLRPGGTFAFFLESPAAASPQQRLGDRPHPRRGVLARWPVPPRRRDNGGARAGSASPVCAPAPVAVRQRDGRGRLAHPAHGGAATARRLPRQGQRVPGRRDDSATPALGCAKDRGADGAIRERHGLGRSRRIRESVEALACDRARRVPGPPSDRVASWSLRGSRLPARSVRPPSSVRRGPSSCSLLSAWPSRRSITVRRCCSKRCSSRNAALIAVLVSGVLAIRRVGVLPEPAT